jgi:hypothetical protein
MESTYPVPIKAVLLTKETFTCYASMVREVNDAHKKAKEREATSGFSYNLA